MAFAFAFVCLIFTLTVWHLRGLYLNWRTAKSLGLPVVFSPVGTPSPFWILSYRVFPSLLTILASLPFGLGNWSKYTYIGWTYVDKHKIHDTLGPAFFICTPWLLELVVADAEITESVLNNRKGFIKPPLFYEPLKVFGQNVDTAEGAEWQKHRRITAPSLNERVSSRVWKESISQARQMLDTWLERGEDGTRTTIDDIVTLALHVLTSAGFGISYSFTNASQQIPDNHKQSYRDALHTVLQKWTLITIIPMQYLTKKWLPASFQRVGQACAELKAYMFEMVSTEKQSSAVANHLLSAMVRVSEESGKSQPGYGLTDEELYGNIFVYSMAGHETTANTLGTAIAYLAADPQWQDWIRDELAFLSRDPEDIDWDYERTFPKLPRCLAVMYETLRLHASAPFIPKISASPQIIPVAGRNITLPSDVFTTINMQAQHTDAEYWGSDALVFRPDRWIVTGTKGPSGSNDHNGAMEEILVTHPEGHYFPWAVGPRLCPGKRFSQVEFVAAIALLFRNCKVDVKCRVGESVQTAQERLRDTIEEAGIHGVTLQITHPEDVHVVWRQV